MQSSLKENCSYISVEHSTWIKGVLMFLIVLGHNMIFTTSLESWGVMSYLYTFHVQGFFLLPFLYGAKPLSRQRVLQNFLRLYWPYFVLALLLSLGMGIANHFEKLTFWNFFKLFLLCDTDSIRTMCGISVLWFLPTMATTLLLRDLFYGAGKAIRIVLLLLSVLAWAAFVCSSLPCLASYGAAAAYLPLGSFAALLYLALGVVFRWLAARVRNVSSAKVLFVCVLLFVGGSYLYFSNVAPLANRETPCFRSLQMAMPLVATMLLYKGANSFCRSGKGFLSGIGRESMVIYLVSPFIGYAAYFAAARVGAVRWEIGILMQGVIVLLAYWVAKSLVVGRLKAFLLPRSLSDFKSVFN